MAKKANETEYQAYLADLLAEMPETSQAAVEEALRMDGVATKLRGGYLRQSEFSRSMDDLAAERKAFEREVAQARENIAGWEKWYADTSQGLADTSAKLQAYESTFGPLDGTPSPTGLSREEVARLTEEQLARRSTDFFNQTMAAADVLTDLKLEHRDRFGKPLNSTELLRFCNERGLPLQAGYKEFVADDMAQLRDKEIQDRIAKAREEGAREALSRHNLPVTSVAREPHPLDLMRETTKNPVSSFDRIAAAAADFTNAMSGKQ